MPLRRGPRCSGFIYAAVAILAVVGVLATSGCAGTPPRPSFPDRSALAPASGGEGIPTFTGPYAAEFAWAWRDSESDFVREVIADEEISDQEWAELGARMTECFARSGLEFGGFTDSGGYSVTWPTPSSESVAPVADACERSSGEIWIHALRISMRSNPSNEPIEDIMTACLIRNGAVASDYSPEQFDRDNPTRSFPYVRPDGEAIFWACNADSTYVEGEP